MAGSGAAPRNDLCRSVFWEGSDGPRHAANLAWAEPTVLLGNCLVHQDRERVESRPRQGAKLPADQLGRRRRVVVGAPLERRENVDQCPGFAHLVEWQRPRRHGPPRIRAAQQSLVLGNGCRIQEFRILQAVQKSSLCRKILIERETQAACKILNF